MAALPARQAAEAESGYAAACCRDLPGRDFLMALADLTRTRRPWHCCTQRPAAANPPHASSAAAHRAWPGRSCSLRTQPRSRAFRRLSHFRSPSSALPSSSPRSCSQVCRSTSSRKPAAALSSPQRVRWRDAAGGVCEGEGMGRSERFPVCTVRVREYKREKQLAREGHLPPSCQHAG